MAPSTLLPHDTDHPDLLRVSDFRRYLQVQPAGKQRRSGRDTHLTTLSPVLRQDLLRFERAGSRGELLDVMAASLRHGRSLLVHLAHGDRVVPLTLFPRERLTHSPLTPAQWAALPLRELSVLQVEPAVLQPPSSQRQLPRSEAALYGPMPGLTWAVALTGARGTLLPELRGAVAYRVTLGATPAGLSLPPAMRAAAQRLQREAANLGTVACWQGLGQEAAARLLNGLYLQSTLIVSRTHPAAAHGRWFGPSWAI